MKGIPQIMLCMILLLGGHLRAPSLGHDYVSYVGDSFDYTPLRVLISVWIWCATAT